MAEVIRPLRRKVNFRHPDIVEADLARLPVYEPPVPSESGWVLDDIVINEIFEEDESTYVDMSAGDVKLEMKILTKGSLMPQDRDGHIKYMARAGYLLPSMHHYARLFRAMYNSRNCEFKTEIVSLRNRFVGRFPQGLMTGTMLKKDGPAYELSHTNAPPSTDIAIEYTDIGYMGHVPGGNVKVSELNNTQSRKLFLFSPDAAQEAFNWFVIGDVRIEIPSGLQQYENYVFQQMSEGPIFTLMNPTTKFSSIAFEVSADDRSQWVFRSKGQYNA